MTLRDIIVFILGDIAAVAFIAGGLFFAWTLTTRRWLTGKPWRPIK